LLIRGFVAHRYRDGVPAVERVIARNTRYVVVEKLGEAASAAIKLDPRRPA